MLKDDSCISSLRLKFYDSGFLAANKKIDVLTHAIELYLDDKQSLRIVDLACGTKPYFPLFKKKAKEYIGLDIDTKKAEFVDVIASAEKLPFVDNCFDVALSTQALEHIRDYQAAVDEMRRVLRPDGVVFLTTHGVSEIHGAPYDYWRFTEYGLREVFRGYNEIHVTKNGGAVLCFFVICNTYLCKLGKYPLNLIAKVAIMINNLLGWYLDMLFEKYDFFVVNYLIVAKK